MNVRNYSRYSDSNQRAASIDDQIRNARAYAERQGWVLSETYCDRAITGARQDRSAYQAMLRDAAAGLFDVLIVDDLSRLGRNMIEAETCVRSLEHRGLRIIAIGDGYDSHVGTTSGRLLNRGAKNLFNEIFLHDLGYKTFRGLEGVAKDKHSAGGKSYGYNSEPVFRGEEIIGYKKVVDESEAKWVRFIFERYADGATPRSIANELNTMKVPSPRGSTWAHSAIYGDMKRGLGILNNALYRGQYLWNRSEWPKDPITGKRKRVAKPQKEWIVSEMPELRIVDQELWDRVKARQAAQQAKTKAIREAKGPRSHGGRGPKYLLSGLLKCGCCGGNFVIVGKDYYGCATRKDRGESVCSNNMKVRKGLAEDILLQHVREDLLSEEAYQEYLAELDSAIKALEPDTSHWEQELRAARKEKENILSAILQGIITPTTKQALEEAEGREKAVEAEMAQIRSVDPQETAQQAKKLWKDLVTDLGNTDDVPKVRSALRELFGEIRLFPNEHGYLEAETNKGRPEAALSSITLVAGAGFEPTTFGL